MKHCIKEKIANILKKNSFKLSVAESCTGGLISSMMTDIDGSSLYTHINFITYSNEAKIAYLNVNKETIKNYGVVSSQVAEEMVIGLMEKTNCDIALATTGIAGPTGGSKDKPVGTIFVGVKIKEKISSKIFQLNPTFDRVKMKKYFALSALSFMFDKLNEYQKIKIRSL